ncbi:hypothetical protein ACQP2E_19120 [Actinoplanes sp. CA-015351]|uniref:hypothetical protein n=1 Tax=Actinoplanes sp. CA-015351 TaxID=3239897 RepID=UPI003D95641A
MSWWSSGHPNRDHERKPGLPRFRLVLVLVLVLVARWRHGAREETPRGERLYEIL